MFPVTAVPPPPRRGRRRRAASRQEAGPATAGRDTRGPGVRSARHQCSGIRLTIQRIRAVKRRLQSRGRAKVGTRSHDAGHAGQPRRAHGVAGVRRLVGIADAGCTLAVHENRQKFLNRLLVGALNARRCSSVMLVSVMAGLRGGGARGPHPTVSEVTRSCPPYQDIFGSKSDLRRAAELRPNLYRDYAALERRIGHTLLPLGTPLPALTGIPPDRPVPEDPAGLNRA